MIKLVIKTPGFVLKLPGVSTELRTPLSLDITKLNINNIVSYLRGLGIVEYQIVSTSSPHISEDTFDSKTKIEKLPKKVVEQPVKVFEKHITMVDNQKEIKNLTKQMTSIQQLLQKLSERNNETTTIFKNDTEEKINVRTKQKVDSFIPSVSTSGMTISSKSKKTTRNESAGDVDYIADLLRTNLSKND